LNNHDIITEKHDHIRILHDVCVDSAFSTDNGATKTCGWQIGAQMQTNSINNRRYL